MTRIVLTLSHGDGVSGTSIFDDGAIAYWTEGRSSDVVFHYANGLRLSIGNSSKLADVSPHIKVLDGDDYGPQRDMTAIEELEHYIARNNWKV